MGMYTELYLACDLKKDTDTEILKWLKAHTGHIDYEEIKNLAPRILKDTRLETINGGSYYFYAQQYFNISFDTISNSYHLVIICNIKNYNNEINKLIELLMPYVDAYKNEHLGHIRYEEEKLPTFILKDK